MQVRQALVVVRACQIRGRGDRGAGAADAISKWRGTLKDFGEHRVDGQPRRLAGVAELSTTKDTNDREGETYALEV